MPRAETPYPANAEALARTDIPYDLLMKIQTGTLAFSYKGVPMLKNPFDLALYSRLLWDLKPRTIVEIGSNAGGSALWFADQSAIMGIPARVISVDITPVENVRHAAVTFLAGDGRDLGAVLPRGALAELPRPLLVVEDADHAYETTRAVLGHVAPVMAPGEMVVVEDGILTAMRVETHYNGGPVRAIAEFLAAHGGDWQVDRTYCDFFGHNVTWNVSGFLRRTN